MMEVEVKRSMNNKNATPTNVRSFRPGQNVQTNFGPGVISSVSAVDAVLYVALEKEPKALYILKPEQIKEAA
jgi:hypothetical protein